MGNKKITIYGLVDPRSKQVFYIGSSTNPATRFFGHMSKRHAPRNMRQAIAKIADAGMKPELKIIEEVPAEDCRRREGYWMDWYRKNGHRLVNVKHAWPEEDTGVSNMGSTVYTWQKDEIEKRAQELDLPRSELVRRMFSFALEHMEFD